MADIPTGASGATGSTGSGSAGSGGATSSTGGSAGAGAGTAAPSSLEIDIAALKDDVARLTDTLQTLVADGAATARNAAREGVDRATAAAENAAAQARARVESAADDLTETIVANPLTSVLIAVGLGYVVGALGRRR